MRPDLGAMVYGRKPDSVPMAAGTVPGRPAYFMSKRQRALHFIAEMQGPAKWQLPRPGQTGAQRLAGERSGSAMALLMQHGHGSAQILVASI